MRLQGVEEGQNSDVNIVDTRVLVLDGVPIEE
jgi:hypothetical protein